MVGEEEREKPNQNHIHTSLKTYLEKRFRECIFRRLRLDVCQLSVNDAVRPTNRTHRQRSFEVVALPLEAEKLRSLV